MKRYLMTLVVSLETDLIPMLAHDGRICGFRLPDGTKLNPIFGMITGDVPTGSVLHDNADLSEAQLSPLGVEVFEYEECYFEEQEEEFLLSEGHYSLVSAQGLIVTYEVNDSGSITGAVERGYSRGEEKLVLAQKAHWTYGTDALVVEPAALAALNEHWESDCFE